MKITRKAYLDLWIDDRYVSRHTSTLEAIESAYFDAGQSGGGDYHVKVGEEVYYEVSIRRVLGSTDGLIVAPNASPPTNNPPVWDSQPVGAFIQGTASDYDMNDISSDPDLDTITFTMNTGAVSLPTGVTWTAGTGVLAYDGVGALAATSGHIITLDDGSDTTESEAFAISISSSYPWYPQMSARAAVTDFKANFRGDDGQTFLDYNYEYDCLYIQQLYPDSGHITDLYNAMVDFSTQNPTQVRLMYTLFSNADPGGSGSKDSFNAETVNTGAREQAWYSFDASGTELYWSGPTIQDPRALNMSYHTRDSGGETYIERNVGRWMDRYDGTTHGSQYDMITTGLLHGWFMDACKQKDGVTNPRYVYSDGTSASRPDYDRDSSITYRDQPADETIGGTDDDDGGQIRYQKGLLHEMDTFQSLWTGPNTCIVDSNGGKDDPEMSEMAADIDNQQYYQAWAGARLAESVETKLQFRWNGSAYEVEPNNPDGRQDDLWRQLYYSYQCSQAAGSNPFGRQLLFMDCMEQGFRPYGSTYDANDLTSADWEYYRFWWGCAMMLDWAIFAPRGPNTGRRPLPMLDEVKYDIGQPDAAREMGSLNLATKAFTQRAPDIDAGGPGNYGVYRALFANGAVYLNLHEPTGASSWPQGSTDTFSIASDIPGGKVARMLDCTTYVHPSRPAINNTCQSQDPDVNDGSLVGSNLTMGRWTARLIVWADS